MNLREAGVLGFALAVREASPPPWTCRYLYRYGCAPSNVVFVDEQYHEMTPDPPYRNTMTRTKKIGVHQFLAPTGFQAAWRRSSPLPGYRLHIFCRNVDRGALSLRCLRDRSRERVRRETRTKRSCLQAIMDVDVSAVIDQVDSPDGHSPYRHHICSTQQSFQDVN